MHIEKPQGGHEQASTDLQHVPGFLLLFLNDLLWASLPSFIVSHIHGVAFILSFIVKLVHGFSNSSPSQG